MKRRPALLAALALTVAAGCGAVDPPERQSVEASSSARPLAFLVEPTTTTVPPSTTTTHPPSPTTTSTTAPPAPPPAPAPAPPSASSGSCGGWEATIAAHFPPEQVATACRVMMCESRGDPHVANESGSGASGLWQFLDSTWRTTTGTAPPASAYSGDVQTAAAAQLWRSSGWSPWSCY